MMVPGTASEPETQEDRKAMICKQVRRFLAFVGIVALCFFLFEPFGQPWAIVWFAVCTFLVSLAMPALLFELNGLVVDTIYYSAVMIAVATLFIAGEPEQEKIQRLIELETLKTKQSAAEKRLSAFLDEKATNDTSIVTINKLLSETETALSEPWVKRLEENEKNTTTKLMASLTELESFVSRIASEHASCEYSRDFRARALAPLFFNGTSQRKFGIRNIVSDIRDRLTRETLMREILRCGNIRIMESSIKGLRGGYSRVLGLLEISRESSLTGVLFDYSAPVFNLSENQKGQINDISKLLNLKRNRASYKTEISNFADISETLKSNINIQNEVIGDIDTEIDKLDPKRAKEISLSGLALTATGIMKLYWPFLLIAFLGLKLARKPIKKIR